MEPQLDKYNMLSNPSLHDGFVDTLHVDEKHLGFIECRSEDGAKVKILFVGIHALQGNNFRSGNIINAISIYSGPSIPKSAIEDLLCFNTPSKREDDARIVKDCQNAKEVFFHLEPSYGLELKVICKQVVLE
jgi:hypothetical protein